MLDLNLLSDETVIKLISTTNYEVALVQDYYGYFVAYTHQGEVVYGSPFKDFYNAAVVFDEIQQQLEGN